MLTRKFALKTAWLNYPKGMSPNDDEGIKLAERAIRQMTGADHVEVSFDHSPSGQPLLDQMRVYCEYPIKEGKYVSLAALEKEQASLLGKVIEALAGDGDAKGAIQQLMDAVGGGSDDGEDKPPKEEESADKPEKPSSSKPPSEEKLPGGPSGGSSSPAVPPAGGAPTSSPAAPPSSSKPRLPFASRAQRREAASRTSSIQKELGVSFKEASQIYRIVSQARSFDEAHKKMSSLIVDENDRPLPKADYVHIAKVARGEGESPLASRRSGTRQ